MKTVNYTYGGPVLKSTAINYYWYDEANKELYVRFTSSGSIAGYKGVPLSEVKNMLAAPSMGSYYASYVKGRYVGINTADVEFTSGKAAKAKAKVANSSDKKFTIAGTVLVPQAAKADVFAATMEEAIAKFLSENEGATVSSVTVNFE